MTYLRIAECLLILGAISERLDLKQFINRKLKEVIIFVIQNFRFCCLDRFVFIILAIFSFIFVPFLLNNLQFRSKNAILHNLLWNYIFNSNIQLLFQLPYGRSQCYYCIYNTTQPRSQGGSLFTYKGVAIFNPLISEMYPKCIQKYC
ncbi:Hypothetical_protein [Hexamita inflata]|uniref:Hypothetical_protein n=1 Tax=Hexamita inflata TaxID=28002 RepID=A0AA86QKD2_9EUKA|nr:Hypothetical protein HINF_LOCUS45687 [Hexamita inflata]